MPGFDRIRLITCLGVDLEMPHLRHFLGHYRRLGICPANIHLIANTPDPDAPHLRETAKILAELGAPPPVFWIAPYTSETMWQQRRTLQARVARPGDWIVNADIDEHHHYPDALPKIVRYCEAKGFDAVQGFLVDRLAPAGELRSVAGRPGLADQFPLKAEVHFALMGRGEHHGLAGTTKLMLHKAHIFPSRGGHSPLKDGPAPRFLAGGRLADAPRAADPSFRFAFPFRVDHYKWTATRMNTYKRRVETPGASKAGLEMGGKMIRYLSESGRIRIEDVAIEPQEVKQPWLDWKLLSLKMRWQAKARNRFARRRPVPVGAER